MSQIYDLTTVFAEGLSAPRPHTEFSEFSWNQDIISDFPWDQIRESQNITCDFDDCGANWYLVYDHNQNQKIAFISRYHPVALVMEECPACFLTILKRHGICIAEMHNVFSCDEAILKQYAPDKFILDDRFLEDENFSFDHEWMNYIYERLERRRSYVMPYEFTFQEIR
ncbi:MAG: hypothetical protein K2O42_06205 [Oscillospiraceae bacterium]|nr:hypothetical protein [Oscillospiraceae bacterium]